MTLTKEQKLEAYTYCLLMALEEIENVFVCNNLDTWGVANKLLIGTFSLSYYPEFLLQKPKNHDHAWWGSSNNLSYAGGTNLDRIAAIERAIELTEQLP